MGNVRPAIFYWESHHLNRDTQGAKAQQKRERNADKNAAKGSKSQAKTNEAAKSIICATCKQAFVSYVNLNT